MARLVNELRELEGPDGTLWRLYGANRLIALARATGDRTKLREAEQLLKKVAETRPDWVRLIVSQSSVEDLLGRPRSAASKCLKAIDLGERHPLVIRQAFALLSRAGYHVEARELEQKLRQEGYNLTGMEAVRILNAVVAQDPAEALRLAEQTISPDTKDYRNLLMLGQLRMAAGKQAEAAAAFEGALRLADKIPETWVTMVSFLVRTGDKVKAEALLRQAGKKLPPETVPLALARGYEILGQPEKARDQYEVALASSPDKVAARERFALFCLRTNRLEEARKQLQKLIDEKGGSPQQLAEARRLLALVLASGAGHEQRQKALELLGVLGDGPETAGADLNPADLRARVLVLAKAQNPRQRRQAVALLENLQRSEPLTPDEQFLLAQLYDTVGQGDKAQQELLGLLTRMGEKLDKSPRRQEALEKQFAHYLNYAANKMLQRGAVEQAQAWLDRLEKLEPKTFRTLALRARLLDKQGQAAEVVPALVALAQKDDAQILPVAGVLESVGALNEAERLYTRYGERTKKAEAVLLRAGFLGRQKRMREALALCEQAWKTCRPEDVASTLVLILYQNRKETEHLAGAAERLAKVVAANPDKTWLAQQLAAVYRLQENYDGMIALYRDILRRDPKDTVTLNNLAWLLALSKHDGAEALQMIDRAIELDGPQAALLDTRAVALLAKGDAARAVKDLEEAITETPTALRYFHLAQVHDRAKNRKAAADAWRRGKNLGLTEDTVDVLERPTFQRLRAELDR